MNHVGKAAIPGAITGLFSGFTGVGGGAILVSLMVSWLGVEQRRAHGTTPVIIVPVALVGAALYMAQGVSGQFRFDTSLALSLIPTVGFPSVAGVWIGATWMSVLPTAHLRRVFGIFVFFVAFSMLTRGMLPIGTPDGASLDVPFIFWIMLGFVAGVFAGFLGLGGGMVIIPFMTLGAGVPQHMAQGVSLAIVAITSIAGAYIHYKLGHVDAQIVTHMAPASFLAVVGASLLAGHLDGFWLTKIFGLAAVYFGYQFTFARPEAKPAPSTPLDPSVGFYQI